MYNQYTYADAERDGQRLAESIGGADAFTESVRRAIRDSYERAFYAGYYRQLADARRAESLNAVSTGHSDGEVNY
jgi:hypothetical protein